jgi:hypothetical protein
LLCSGARPGLVGWVIQMPRTSATHSNHANVCTLSPDVYEPHLWRTRQMIEDGTLGAVHCIYVMYVRTIAPDPRATPTTRIHRETPSTNVVAESAPEPHLPEPCKTHINFRFRCPGTTFIIRKMFVAACLGWYDRLALITPTLCCISSVTMLRHWSRRSDPPSAMKLPGLPTIEKTLQSSHSPPRAARSCTSS